MKHRRLLLSVPGLLALPLLGACASTKQLADYESEIVALREERTTLKKEITNLRGQLDDYQVALSEANMRLLEEPTPEKSYPELDSLGVGYGQRDGNMVITLASEVTFASGKAELTDAGKKALRAVASTLTSDYGGNTYWIEGHTDTDPIRKSSFDSNRDLSVSRAMSVLHYLVEECGVPDSQCSVVGHGEYRPVASNDSTSNKAKNRRVEIVVRAS